MAWAKTTASSTKRGYGTKHRKLRAALASQHQPTDPCVRCGHALGPMGPWLHLDHNDQRTAYLGFSHGRQWCPTCGQKCNLKAGAKKARAIQVASAQVSTLTGCPICGNTVAAGRTYCSQRCGYIANINKTPKPKAVRTEPPSPPPPPQQQPRQRECVICGTHYISKRKYCSDVCMWEWNARSARERYREQEGLPSTWLKPRTAHRW